MLGSFRRKPLEGQDEGVLGGEGKEEAHQQGSGEDNVEDAISIADSHAAIQELDGGQAETGTLSHQQLGEEAGLLAYTPLHVGVLSVTAALQVQSRSRVGRLPNPHYFRAVSLELSSGRRASQGRTRELAEAAAA